MLKDHKNKSLEQDGEIVNNKDTRKTSLTSI